MIQFGHIEDVRHDCCGFCPKPVGHKNMNVARAFSKVYVSGDVSFKKDDPGRQVSRSSCVHVEGMAGMPELMDLRKSAPSARCRQMTGSKWR